MRKKTGNKDKRILDAAVYIFAHNGYANTKIADIAERAGVSVGSVYLYYKDKENILLQIMGNIWKESYMALKKAYKEHSGDIREKIYAFIDTILSQLSGNKEVSMLIAHEQNFWLMLNKGIFIEYYNDFFNLVKQILEEGKNTGTVNRKLNTEIITTLLIGGIRYIIYTWQRNDLVIDQKTIREQLELIFNNGIFCERNQ